MGKGQQLYLKAKKLIPGGTQLLSKRPEMFLPGLWPAYYSRSKGCEVWDLDGKRYTDMSYMGIGACVLGYADEEVNLAVRRAIAKGNMNTLNAPEEVELAQILCALHPWAEMVRYARSGGEAMSIAVRIARAKTGKDVVLFCGYHGWHDWYLSANLAADSALDGHLLAGLSPKGVPRGLEGTARPFAYNDTKTFLKLLEETKGSVGVVVMESIRNFEPEPEFIATIKQATKDRGIVLVFDEVTAGWRLNQGGAHLRLGVEPDIAVFGKAMSNGFSMAAVIGRGDVMQAAQDTFISSTYWTDRLGPAAALATIKKMKAKNVPKHLIETGRAIQQGWRAAASRHGLEIKVEGIEPLGHFNFISDQPSEMKTLFVQCMLERGFLASTAFYASYAHKPHHVRRYLDAVNESIEIIAKAFRTNRVKAYLKGAVSHAGFRRLA